MSKVLDVKKLSVEFLIKENFYPAVNNIDLFINEGEMLALVGESGCGKTQAALACVNLSEKEAKVSAENISITDKNVTNYKENEWNKLLGEEVSMIFQEPMTALNPLMKVGKQIAENAQNAGIPKEDAKKSALLIMKKVGLSEPEGLYNKYPHQLSGGMRQRIMIALSLINNPSLLIADEPTTALDVTTQAQILDLIKELNKEFNTAVLMITHDLGVVKATCDRVYVMYAGKIVETGLVKDVMKNPFHPYTKALLNSIPSFEKRGGELEIIDGIVPPLEKRRNIGCLFYERCKERKNICLEKTPEVTKAKDREVFCHLYN